MVDPKPQSNEPRLVVGKRLAIWVNDGTPEGAWFFAPGHDPTQCRPRWRTVFILSLLVLSNQLLILTLLFSR